MLVRIIMRNKKVVKILCVILAAAMPVSSGVGVQAAQAGAVAATADQTDDVQNAAETSAEDSAQNADSDDLEGSIQYLDDSAQTNNSDAQQDGNATSEESRNTKIFRRTAETTLSLSKKKSDIRSQWFLMDREDMISSSEINRNIKRGRTFLSPASFLW